MFKSVPAYLRIGALIVLLGLAIVLSLRITIQAEPTTLAKTDGAWGATPLVPQPRSYEKRIVGRLPGWAALTGSYSDVGVDTDGNGLYDSLKLSVGIWVTQTERYNVVAWLRDGTGTNFAWAATSGTLPAGAQTVDLFFDGVRVRNASGDGPYAVSRVELRMGDEGLLADGADNVHTTAAYFRARFDPPAVALTGSFGSSGIDGDGDGFYNTLQVSVGLHASKPGAYTVTGALYDARGRLLANTLMGAMLSAGNQTATLSFDGLTIRQWRANGPYRLSYVGVVDDAGNRPAFALQPYTTTAYAYTSFQRGAAEFTGSYSDVGVDTDSNGQYDVLRLSVGVNVLTGGTYKLAGALSTTEGRELTWSSQSYTLTVGAQTLLLDLDGRAIGESAVDGPYRVTCLTLYDATGSAISFEPNVYSTTAHAYASFEGAGNP